MPLENKTKELIEKKVNELGYSLVEAKLQKEGKDYYLHVVIDRDDPINLDDIVVVSDSISIILDSNDPIDDKYILDVSSLGVEKPIKIESLKKYINDYVAIHLSNPLNGLNAFEGKILEVDNEFLILQIKDKTRRKTIKIAIKDIDKAKLAIEF